MSNLIDITSLFADILPDPAQQQQERLATNLGLFNNGLPGALASATTRFQRESRGQLQKAGTAVNPEFDVRTPEQKYRAAINSISPEDPDAEAKYIEATRQFMPSKLPQLTAAIRQRRIEDERLERERTAEGRAVNADERADEWHDARIAQMDRNNELTDLKIGEFRTNQDQQAAAREYLKNSSYASRKDAQYLEAVDTLPVQALYAEVQAAMSQDQAVSDRLTNALNAILPEDSELRGVIDDFSIAEKRMILAQEDGRNRPDWRVVTDRTGSYAVNIAAGESIDETKIRISKVEEPVRPPESERPTETAIEGARALIQDNNMEDEVAEAFGYDKLNAVAMAEVYQRVRDDLAAAQQPHTMRDVINVIMRTAAQTEQEAEQSALEIVQESAFGQGTGF